MNKFYDNIDSNQLAELLTATPYAKSTENNFALSLTKKTFFDYLYTQRSDSVENELFDKKVDHALRGLANRFAKVTMLHIAGYAGTGKTTYIHYLLWSKKNEIGKYDVVDYEGYKRAVEPFIYRISHLLYGYRSLGDIVGYFTLVYERELFNIDRFRDQIPLLEEFCNRLTCLLNQTEDPVSESQYKKCIDSYEAFLNGDSEGEELLLKERVFISFLLFVEFLLLLYDRFYIEEAAPMILVIDNSDSLHKLSEEMILLPVLREFVNDCNYFFAFNLLNDAVYNGIKIQDVCNNTKLVVFFTTRVATIHHYEIVEPDWEKINGWTSLELPENYYDHKEIINHRIDYYLSQEWWTGESEVVDMLKVIRGITDIAYRNYNFKRLFNGNIRVCVEKICAILKDYPMPSIMEVIKLYNSNYDLSNEGANGYFLSMVLYELKKDDLYKKKLDLSRCMPDGTVSLSRIVLTIIRERGDSCSLLELFQLLIPLDYSEEEICTTVWNLCETEREKWRRLVIFDLIIPTSLNELKMQGNRFRDGDDTIDHYSEIVICTAGQAYMEFVVPHFEFMLSRHEQGIERREAPRYQPLFASVSEQRFRGKNNELFYRFEQKIDWVYRDVSDCCANSLKFADKSQKAFHMNRKEYINSYFNYHSQGWNGEVGPKQSYESRLIFRHVGYIERYRCYLLAKYSDKETKRDINRRLVDRIVRYIKLYQDSHKCYQTEPQNRAADDLLLLANKIKNSQYYDFETKIETPY